MADMSPVAVSGNASLLWPSPLYVIGAFHTFWNVAGVPGIGERANASSVVI